MGLFSKKRKRKNQRFGPTEKALADLIALSGEWTGVSRDYEPDGRQYGERPIGMGFNLDDDGRHLVIHYWVNHGGPVMRSFDVLGVESGGQELVRTRFVGRNRQSHHFRILRHTSAERSSDFALSLETTSWDEARPCEFKWSFERKGAELEIQLARRLIGNTDDYEEISTSRLTRMR